MERFAKDTFTAIGQGFNIALLLLVFFAPAIYNNAFLRLAGIKNQISGLTAFLFLFLLPSAFSLGISYYLFFQIWGSMGGFKNYELLLTYSIGYTLSNLLPLMLLIGKYREGKPRFQMEYSDRRNVIIVTAISFLAALFSVLLVIPVTALILGIYFAFVDAETAKKKKH